MQGEYLSQKLLPAPIYNPIFLATNALLGIKKFLVAIFVKRQIKLRREWFFLRCFFNDPIPCKSLHNMSIKRNRPPAQGRVAADVETQWHQRIWHRDILGHWENIMFVILPNLRVFIFIHEKWNGHLVKGSQYWTFWSNDVLHSDQIWVMGIVFSPQKVSMGLFKCSTRPKLYPHSISVLFHPCGWSCARLFENILSIGLENVDLENKVLVTVLLKILVLSEPSKKWITFETFC